MKAKKPSPANALCKQIIIHFNCNRLGYIWRNNTTGVYDPTIKTFRFNRSTEKGAGDIVGTLSDGRHIEIEVKIGKDKQSDAQIAHEQKVKQNNGLYFVVKTFEDYEKHIKTLIN